jgi:alanyl-tRNA synthetase
VRRDLPVSVLYTSLPAARELGALALFGETYDETVRVVEIGGPWSIELCGGTHVEHSSQIGPVSVIGESSVGSGLRRIEAYVGIDAMRHLATERAIVSELAGMLKVPSSEVPARVEALVERLRTAEKELERMRSAAVLSSAAGLVAGAEQIGDVALVAAALADGLGAGDLRALATDVRSRFGDRPAVVALFSTTDGTVSFVVGATPAAVSAGRRSGDLVSAFADDVQGRGGGRPDLAQGGGSRPDGVDAAIASLRARLAAVGS